MRPVAVAALIVLCTPFCGALPYSSTTDCDCSSDRCTSPDPFGGTDCWSGVRGEASCSAGSFYLTGSSTQHLGATYNQYTCCTGSDIQPSCYDTTMSMRRSRAASDYTDKRSCEEADKHWDEEDQKCNELDDTGNLIVGLIVFSAMIACVVGIIVSICKCFNCCCFSGGQSSCFSGGQSTGVLPAQQAVLQPVQQPIQMGQHPVQMTQPYQTAQQPIQLAQQPMEVAQQPIQMGQQPMQMAQPYQTVQQPMPFHQPPAYNEPTREMREAREELARISAKEKEDKCRKS